MSVRCLNKTNTSFPLQGLGLGLRAPHVKEILETQPDLQWFELLADNHICDGGWLRRQAQEIATLYPVSMHCVGMSIGSVDPLNFEYLKKIKALADEVKPKLISDHLCWTSLNSHYSHDLLPLPYTEEALKYVADRILAIQDYLGDRIAVENVSAYLTYKHSVINEVDFVNALAEMADCWILFDINNVYVNQKNNAQDAQEYINKINLSRVVEIHLAGFEDKGHYYLDAHNNQVNIDVWELYEFFLERGSNAATLIEWDHDIPDFNILYAELMKAQLIKTNVFQAREEKYDIAITR